MTGQLLFYGPLPVLLVSWLAPALFLSGIGLYVSLRTRVVAFGVVIVVALWIVFGLFGRFFLPGLAVPAPLNLIQPFLWPFHVHASLHDLVPSDFWLNRLFLSGAGITLILLAVRSLGDSENVLLNARSRKTGTRSEQVPPEQSPLPNHKRDFYHPVAVRPHLVAQIAGIAIYEFRMLWRQRVMRVFAITPVVLFLFMVAINMFDKMGSGAIVSLLPPEQGALVYGEFVVSMTATFIIAMVLWLYPLLVANQVPSDHRIGVAELLRTLPMNDSTYLIGKTLGAVLAGASALVLAAVIYAVVWFLRVGPFYLIPLLSILSLCLLLLLVTTSQGILLGATQASTPRALAVVLALLIVPEFLQAIPVVQQFLPGSADFLTLSVNRSLESIMVMPPVRRGFDPLNGTLAALYNALLIKTVLIALLVWAWRRLKK